MEVQILIGDPKVKEGRVEVIAGRDVLKPLHEWEMQISKDAFGLK